MINLVSVPTSRRLIVVGQSPLLYRVVGQSPFLYRAGVQSSLLYRVAVQSPLFYHVVGRNGKVISPRGPTTRSPPYSPGVFVFSFSRPLTGVAGWLLFLVLLPFSDLSLFLSPHSSPFACQRQCPTLNPGPAPVRPTIPKFTCSVCARKVERTPYNVTVARDESTPPAPGPL